MLTRLYRLIWLLLHLLLCLYENLRWLQAATQRWSYDRLRRRGSGLIDQRDFVFLERCKRDLEKLPAHVTIIVGSDGSVVDEELLTRLIKYALIMDIGCISIYDTRPLHRGRLSLAKVRTPDGLHCKQLSSRRYMWSTTAAMTAPTIVANSSKLLPKATNGATNGTAVGGLKQQPHVDKSIEIYEITASDGHTLIADVCRSLYEQYRYNPTAADAAIKLQAQQGDYTKLQQRISDELAQRLDALTEPQLGLIFSESMCTYGLLPWHARFTEFQTFPACVAFTASTFAHALYKYSRCEQRWGR